MSRRPMPCPQALLLLLAASTCLCLGVPWPPGTEPRPAAPSPALLARIERAKAARVAAVRPEGIAPYPGNTEQGARGAERAAAGSGTKGADGTGYLRVTPREAKGDKAAPADAGKVTYAYDVKGNLTSMTIPLLGRTVTYAYDNLDQLTSITDGPGKVYIFAHDVLGRRTSLTRPNAVVTSYAYDAASQLQAVRHQSGTTLLEKAEYTYTPQGLRDSLASLAGVQQFTYDDTGQVTSASYPERPAEAFRYDEVGNHTANGQVVDAANRLLEDNQYTYAYDANGNLTTKTAKADGGVTTYTWDKQDRLTSVTLPGGQTTTFTYRFDGKRTSRTDTRGEVRFLYTGLDVFAITDAAGTVQTDFIYGPGIDEPLSLRSSGAEYAYVADALGSVLALVDATGVVVERYDYSAFGQTRIRDATGTVLADSALGNPYGFTAREMENGIGLMYYRARYYTPGLARFVSEDPIGILGGTNPQSYLGNTPVNAVDPSGLLGQDAAQEQLWRYAIPTSSSGRCTDRNRRACTSLEGVQQASIDEVTGVKQAKPTLPVVVTGGTEMGHSKKGKSRHENGGKLDIQSNEGVLSYVRSHFTYIGVRQGLHGGPMYVSPSGGLWVYEHLYSHFDITRPQQCSALGDL